MFHGLYNMAVLSECIGENLYMFSSLLCVSWITLCPWKSLQFSPSIINSTCYTVFKPLYIIILSALLAAYVATDIISISQTTLYNIIAIILIDS